MQSVQKIEPCHQVAAHWGTYRVRYGESGAPHALEGLDSDPDPSPIAQSMIGALTDSARIGQPMVRASFLEHGHRAGGTDRGRQAFVPLAWDSVLDLLEKELKRVIGEGGNQSIFGGSYGWASAGRFHHAQSQIHRFLNSIGGYTRSVQNYSFAAGMTILPHVIGTLDGIMAGHTDWRSIIENTETAVMFGGVPHRNAQVNAGGVSRHILNDCIEDLANAGCEIVTISPVQDDAPALRRQSWISIIPGTDVALMLAVAYVLETEGLADKVFLDRYTVGHDRFAAYLLGTSDGQPKSPQWAAPICDVPAEWITSLARRMARTRTMIMMSWSLQRADYGEQPYWMAITLAAMLGQIGLPGGGFGFGYGASNGVGNSTLGIAWPSMQQGENPVREHVPVARISDMLLNPGGTYAFNGEQRIYPEIKMIYWAGGNPFHHQQDINKLLEAWRKPQVVVVHDSWWNPLARHADIVLPVATQLERNDISMAARERMIAASHKIAEPFGMSLTDFEIFSRLSERFGVFEEFTESRGEEQWLRHLYAAATEQVRAKGLQAPGFDDFWQDGLVTFPEPEERQVLFGKFRDDPVRHKLSTPSGKIEIYSEKIAGFGYDDCPAHPVWLAPREWLGAELRKRYPLHMLSSQPATRLHSQYDNGIVSQSSKIRGREPISLHPADAAARGISQGDVVRVFNDRGSCLAGAVLCEALRPGVVNLATGAWYDPLDPFEPLTLDKHGNPNVLTADRGTSKLSQGCSAQSCLVEIERFDGDLPPITAYSPPEILEVVRDGRTSGQSGQGQPSGGAAEAPRSR